MAKLANLAKSVFEKIVYDTCRGEQRIWQKWKILQKWQKKRKE